MPDRGWTAGVVMTTSSALLIVALLLEWWGPPAELLGRYPGAGLSDELRLSIEALGFRTGDAFEYFAWWDRLWLLSGITGFFVGLLLLLDVGPRRPLAAVTVLLGATSALLIGRALIDPPDAAEIGAAALAQDPPEAAMPLGREPGGFVALGAALGMTAGALLALWGGARRRASSSLPAVRR
jgi:hypothetical protein